MSEIVNETIKFSNARELFLALMNVPNLENVGIEQHDARDVHAFELVQRTLPDQSTQAHIRFLPFVAPLQTEPGCQLCGSGFLTAQNDGGVICDACGHEHSESLIDTTNRRWRESYPKIIEAMKTIHPALAAMAKKKEAQ
jgi:hypothetical protein